MIEKYVAAANTKLLAPTSFFQATADERAEHCNGMGPKGAGFLVPDTMYGLNMTPAGDIHDWMYTFPEGRSKQVCDDIFLQNMLAIINAKDAWGWVTWLRKRRAHKYYYAVQAGGDSHFAG